MICFRPATSLKAKKAFTRCERKENLHVDVCEKAFLDENVLFDAFLRIYAREPRSACLLLSTNIISSKIKPLRLSNESSSSSVYYSLLC